MPYERRQLDFALKLPLAPGLQGTLTAFDATARILKKAAEKINAGLPNEENTTLATKHICEHDLIPNSPCVSEDI